MNIIEAVKSGKSFGRNGRWYPPVVRDGYTQICFEYSDIVAENWEIEKTIEISKAKLETAIDLCFVDCGGWKIKQALIKELGLE